MHEGGSIERKVSAQLDAADSSPQLINQVRGDGIVVREHDLIVMLEICFSWEEQDRLKDVDGSLVLVRPAAKHILF